MKNSWWMRGLCIIFLGWLLATTSFAAAEKNHGAGLYTL